MPTPFKNQATDKYLGYVYQILIAIEIALKAEKNQTVWIECFGDIYNGYQLIETKKHKAPHNLTSNAVDFWKTLHNFLMEDTETVKKFILHTTSAIQNNSIFFDWNNKNKQQKYDILKLHSPSKSISKYYNTIFQDDYEYKLLFILDNFTIASSRNSVPEQWDRLKQDRIIEFFAEYSEHVLDLLYSYVNRQAIIDNKTWQININDFFHHLQQISKVIDKRKFPFPIMSEQKVDSHNGKYAFVKELETIKLRENDISMAVSDYLRSQNSVNELCKKNPDIFVQILNRHDNAILYRLRNKKSEYFYKIDESNINDLSKNSRNLYLDCINNIEKINIPEFDNIPEYYQNGRIHYNVNQKNFSWLFTEEDFK